MRVTQLMPEEKRRRDRETGLEDGVSAILFISIVVLVCVI